MHTYSLNDFLRKFLCVFHRKTSSFLCLNYRRIKTLLYLKKWNVIIGKNVSFRGYIQNISIAKDLNVYSNCSFELNPDAILNIGESCLFSYGVIISCSNKIIIGDFVQIGEYTSLRDSTHNYSDIDIPMKFQKDISGEILIGNDVWIGRNCIIMAGSVIEDGVIVGANSLVKGRLKKNGIYAGTPIKLIKMRKSEETYDKIITKQN